MLSYGTAGFRAHHSLLDRVLYRCGILMAIRSKYYFRTGVMITASHNKWTDNGVKLIDYNGEMLDEEWQKYANDIVNADEADLQSTINSIHEKVSSHDLPPASPKHVCIPVVVVGYDTRESAERLANECKAGIESQECEWQDVGRVTTPEMHYYVAGFPKHNICIKIDQEEEKNINKYTNYIMTKFVDILLDSTLPICHVDCANGVVSLRMKELAIPSIKLYNTDIDTPSALNHECGADFVEKNKDFPANMDDVPEGELCFSTDGDGDRVVCFMKKDNKFKLFNGDHIAILFACMMNKMDIKGLKKGIVQTAYANGASTLYIKKHLPEFEVVQAKTGVKNLHKKAMSYDIGIYFEANGHGTILAKDFLFFPLCQYTGDAIANMLLIMRMRNEQHALKKPFSLTDLTFEDFPSKHTKLAVSPYYNRDDFVLNDDETKVISPPSVQTIIDDILAPYPYQTTRAFLRPSGTEDVLRLYVEAATEEDVETITTKLTALINPPI